MKSVDSLLLRWALFKTYGPDRTFFSTLNDGEMLSLYNDALQFCMGDSPHASILDCGGAGGLFSLIAADAKRNVTRYEPVVPLRKALLDILHSNSQLGPVKFLGHSDDPPPNTPFDIVIFFLPHSNLFSKSSDIALLNDGFHSFVHSLSSQGLVHSRTVFIPSALSILASFVSLPPQPEPIARPVSRVCNFDYSAFNAFVSSSPQPVRAQDIQFEFLTTPSVISNIDISSCCAGTPIVLSRLQCPLPLPSFALSWLECALPTGPIASLAPSRRGGRQLLQAVLERPADGFFLPAFLPHGLSVVGPFMEAKSEVQKWHFSIVSEANQVDSC
jgi:hypothetical protein